MLERQGRTTTAAHFRTALDSLSKFRQGKDLDFSELDGRLCQDYENHLRNTGHCRNTSSAYMRCLRVVFNNAVAKGMATNRNPFAHIFTGNDKTQKRALTLEEMRLIRHIDLTGKPRLQFARDIFLLSFYCRGMSLVDMAGLKQSDISGNKLAYIRAKTGARLSIDWLADMQAIVDRHGDKASPYLLPLRSGGTSGANRPPHKSAGQAINRNLAKVARLAGIGRGFTLYAARHTWATLARDSGTTIDIIKDGMGHTDIKTTQIYLASMNASLVDEANCRIIRSLDFMPAPNKH